MDELTESTKLIIRQTEAEVKEEYPDLDTMNERYDYLVLVIQFLACKIEALQLVSE